MKNINITAFAFAIGIALSGNAMADSMSKDQYKLAKKKLISNKFPPNMA